MTTIKSIENVLTGTLRVHEFNEIEGFNDNLYRATQKLIRYVLKATDESSITENCRVAWAMLSAGDKAVLEEHYGKKNIAHIMLALKNIEHRGGGLFKKMFGGG